MVTAGHGKVNVPGEAVPSTVPTVVRCTIWKLSPVISSMFMVFHGEGVFVSGVHVAVILLPSLKTFPGLGSEGVGSAKATNARDKMKVGNAKENIEAARLFQQRE